MAVIEDGERHWEIRIRKTRNCTFVALSIMMLIPATKPFHEVIQLAILVLWLVGLLLVSRQLIRYLLFVDLGVRVRVLLDACSILGLTCLGFISPTACLSLAFIVYLPSVVLEAIAIAEARGRV